MAKYVDKQDLENQQLQTLRIRRGCSGRCACLGTCMLVVGRVERKDYDEFMKTFVTLDQFLTSKCDNEQ